MTFSNDQNAELAKPLDRKYVKPPAAGKRGDYVEGWHVIAEANRIFGFDGWVRETVSMIETNRELLTLKGQNGDYQQWRVGFVAKVRISAGGITRDGTGFGSGMSKPEALGEAIESAVKEAETDAMKRALMTFGNPFGLALYDKTQANVATVEHSVGLEDHLSAMQEAASLEELQAAFGTAWKAFAGPNSRKTIKNHYDARKTALTPMPATLGAHLDNLERAEKAGASATVPN
jgi:DNA repair and recombination protein RAD52